MKKKVATARSALVDANKKTQGTNAYNVSQRRLAVALGQLTSLAPPLKQRIEMFTSGAVDLCLEIAQTEGKHLDQTLDNAWWVLSGAMCVINAIDRREFESVHMAVNKGLVEWAVWEISKEPLRLGGKLADHAFIALTNTAGRPEFVSRVLNAGAVELCVSLVRRARMDTEMNIAVLESAINTLSWLALSRPEALRTTPGVVDGIIPLLRNLNHRRNDRLMMLGFRAAKTLVRLMSKDDTCRVVSENNAILDTYADVISRAMASGPSKGFEAYNGNWSLPGFAIDLSLISLTGLNKPLLACFVPHVLDMVALYGKNDANLVHHCMIFLSQLTFDEQGMVKLNEGKAKIVKTRTMLRAMKVLDVETISLFFVVVKAVLPSLKT